MPQLSGISPARSDATACVLSATLLTCASRPYFLRKPPSSADQIAAFAALTLTEPRRTFSEAGALVGGVGALAPGAAGLGAATPPQATSSPPTEYTRSSRRFRVGRMFGTPPARDYTPRHRGEEMSGYGDFNRNMIDEFRARAKVIKGAER